MTSYATLAHLDYALSHLVHPDQPLALTVSGVSYLGFDVIEDDGALLVVDAQRCAGDPLLADDLREHLRAQFPHLLRSTRLLVNVPGRGWQPLMEDFHPVIEAVGSELAYPARLRRA